MYLKLAGALLCTTCLFGQADTFPGPVVVPAPVPLNTVVDMPDIRDFHFMFNFEQVTGHPYAAEETVRSSRELGDGNRIVSESHIRTFRDSQGRTRRETTTIRGGTEQPATVISISDPVAGVSYTLDPVTKVAHKMLVPNRFGEELLDLNAALGKMNDARKKLQLAIPPQYIQQFASNAKPDVYTGGFGELPPPEPVHGTGVASTHEELGSRLILGVKAEGTRDSTTIPAGVIGNEKPIITLSERWFCPDLGIEMKSLRNDPRSGKNVMEVTKLNTAEPAASLFQVPSDYKIEGGNVVLAPALRRSGH